MKRQFREMILRNKKEEAIKNISNISINAKTIFSILKKCFNDEKNNDWSKIGISTLNLLYNSSHKLKLLSVFKNVNNKNEIILLKSDDGDIDIFGRKYLSIKRCEINTEI